MSDQIEIENTPRKIVIMKDGSYHVMGNISLVHKIQVVSEFGEPLTWVKEKDYHARNNEGKDFYGLCRCGESQKKPFCDATHREIEFDGTETAHTGSTEMRSIQIPRGTHIIVKKDSTLCMESGFCGFRDVGINQLVSNSSDTKTRSLIIAMVERCPSGALTYRIEEDGQNIEPDLPVQIAVTTEITSEGEIPGPLWVTGYVPIERSDGKPFETRNRLTLCNCGKSSLKPLCDGTHRHVEEQALKKKNFEETS